MVGKTISLTKINGMDTVYTGQIVFNTCSMEKYKNIFSLFRLVNFVHISCTMTLFLRTFACVRIFSVGVCTGWCALCMSWDGAVVHVWCVIVCELCRQESYACAVCASSLISCQEMQLITDNKLFVFLSYICSHTKMSSLRKMYLIRKTLEQDGRMFCILRLFMFFSENSFFEKKCSERYVYRVNFSAAF